MNNLFHTSHLHFGRTRFHKYSHKKVRKHPYPCILFSMYHTRRTEQKQELMPLHIAILLTKNDKISVIKNKNR